MSRKPAFELRCRRCAKPFAAGFHPFCDGCESLVDVRYDLERCRLHESENPYERFRDLLPVADPNRLPRDAAPTPCVHAERLGEVLGLRQLFLKDETVLPTGSTKDRMAAVSLAFLLERGVVSFATSSTGNSSTAYAREIRRYPEIRMFLFTGEDFQHRVQCLESDNAVCFALRGATFVEAFEFAGHFARLHGKTAERGFFNPGRREGLKLAFMEACDQVPGGFDWYAQAVSSAMGVYGTDKGARELHGMGRILRPPRLLCVQQETCSPMVDAFAAGSETIRTQDLVARPTGIADAILRGNPTRAYPYVREIVLASGGTLVKVSESEIREARAMLEELEGLRPCFSASAAVAGLARRCREGALPRDDRVLVNLTGRVREPRAGERAPVWLKQAAEQWIPEDPHEPVCTEFWGQDDELS